MKRLIYFGVEQDAPKQEILSLKWRDVHLENGPAGLIRFLNKNEEERAECIMPRTRQALMDWKSHL